MNKIHLVGKQISYIGALKKHLLSQFNRTCYSSNPRYQSFGVLAKINCHKGALSQVGTRPDMTLDVARM